jgi:hypothetical protein
MSDQLHVVLQPVHAERADDFERFATEVVAPAMRAQRPDFAERWRVMRAAAPDNGTVTYAFLLEGGRPEDWELEPLLAAHYGQEEATRLLADWSETLAPLAPWAESAVAEGEESNQVVWSLESLTAP